MKIKDITKLIEEAAPHAYAESWDNVGLLVGDANKEVSKVLLALDFSEDVLDEAIEKRAELIITHHPVIFGALKKITANSYTSKLIIKAIKNDVAIYAAHTNLDNISGGLNFIVAEKFGMENCRVLEPTAAKLYKLTCFVPIEHTEKLLTAVFDAGAGQIGNYDSCSFSSEGMGSFKANDKANPFVGELNKIHYEPEKKIEVIIPSHRLSQVVNALVKAHPYEEPAYDIIVLENKNLIAGSGVIGNLPQAISENDFLSLIKDKLQTKVLRHSKITNKNISKVAICTGAGGFLLPQAISKGADAFITGDVKYHDFFVPDNCLLLVDAGHYETEQFCREWFADIIKSKFNDLNVEISERGGNPVEYF